MLLRLVSLLDDRTWEALAQLPAPEALAVIDQVVENMKRQELRNPNAFFMVSMQRSYYYQLQQRRALEWQVTAEPVPAGSVR